MIKTKKELEFYIIADRIMAGLPEQQTKKELLVNFTKEWFGIYKISEYLKATQVQDRSAIGCQVQTLIIYT